MNSLQKVVESMESWFSGHAEVNSVTKGDANELDVLKATKFPVAHIFPESMTVYEGYTTHTFRVWILGQDHWEDIYRLSTVTQEFMNSVTKGFLYDEQIFSGEPLSADVMYDFGQNRLYGWEITFGLDAPNNLDNCA